jgi:hypothetical protein
LRSNIIIIVNTIMSGGPQDSGESFADANQQLVTLPRCDKEKASMKDSQKQNNSDSKNTASNSSSQAHSSTQDVPDTPTRKRSWNWVSPNYVRTLPANVAAKPNDRDKWRSDPTASEFKGVDHQSSHRSKIDPFVEWGSHEPNGGAREVNDWEATFGEDEDGLE